MPSGETLLLFLGVSVLLTLAPGPDIVYLIAQSLANGRRAGLATAMGLASGNLGHTLAVALGAAVLFSQSAAAFGALKIAGVAYLLWLGVQSLRASPRGIDGPPPAAQSSGALFLRGLAMNLLNPKVLLFFLALLPQFSDPALGAVTTQLIVLGLVFTAQVVVVFGATALFAAAAGAALRGRGGQRLQRWGNYLVTCVLFALAARLALAQPGG